LTRVKFRNIITPKSLVA